MACYGTLLCRALGDFGSLECGVPLRLSAKDSVAVHAMSGSSFWPVLGGVAAVDEAETNRLSVITC